MKINFKEYISHKLIGTPLEKTAHQVRKLTQINQQIKHPELQEIHVESDRVEAALRQIIDRSMNCIDVGAHLGSMLNLIQELSPEGKHIAIEPIPYKYQWLKQKFPNVAVFQVALNEVEREAEFYIQPNRSGFSGLRFHGSNEKSNQNLEVIKVKCVRLDDIIPSDLPIGFIKIDVEGGELVALKGSERILNRYHPIILFECTKSALKAHEVAINEVYEFFQIHQYSIFLIKDWLANKKALSYEQFVESMEYPFQAFNFLAIPK